MRDNKKVQLIIGLVIRVGLQIPPSTFEEFTIPKRGLSEGLG